MLRANGYLMMFLGLILLSSVWKFRCDSNDTNNEPKNSEPISRRLSERCREVHKMKRISQMQQLIELVREFGTATSSSQSRLTIIPPMNNNCINHSQQLLDLEDLISERRNVCKSSHIDKIEAYTKKYLTGLSRFRAVTRKFFLLYVHQVSMICKRNLFHNLNKANNQLSKIVEGSNEEPITMETYQKIIPWLNEKLNAVCSNDGMTSAENKAKCEAMEVLSSIDTIDELTTAIDSAAKNRVALKRNEIIKKNSYQALIDDNYNVSYEAEEGTNDSKEMDSREVSHKVASTVPVSVRKQVNTIREVCFRLKPTYANTVLPVVRLAQLEMDTEYEEFDKKCQEEETMKLWFSITIVCESALTSNLASNFIQMTNTMTPEEGKKAIDQTEIIDELLDNPDYLDDNPIEDELWIGNYRPRSLTRFKYTLMGKLLRTLKINQLFETIAMDKNFRNSGDIVFGIVVAAVSVIGIATNIS